MVIALQVDMADLHLERRLHGAVATVPAVLDNAVSHGMKGTACII